MRATAPGKVMLIGEYIVLEGHRSLLVAVDRFAVASIGQLAPGPGKRSWQVEAPDSALAGVNALCEALQLSGWFTVDTSAFLDERGVKLGLGSSAAALASLAALAAPDAPPAKRFILAHEAHSRSQQEIGSGADVATSTFGRVLLYRNKPYSFEQLAPNQLGVSLLCVETGLAASTTSLVQRVLAHRLRAAVDALFGRMAEVSEAAIQALRASEAQSFLTHLSHYGRLVQSLGEETQTALWLPSHSRADEVARAFGGCAKPTGAGGGDLILVAVPTEHEAPMRAALTSEGLRCLDLRLSLSGSTLEEQIQTAPLAL